ncbi:MAG: UDP-N-acetylmuramate--L-alanine ligase [Bacteroidetes bacterium GWF2_49_14]|nr:MAG: UDP-N-acetylmuramate--L-alanine ligase [Bacteroidetes bacterium GWF2_49_14]
MDRIERVYFLGIGGIGMSALARFFRSLGKAVAGYDRTSTPLTRALESEGISIHYEDNPDMIPFAVTRNQGEPQTLIVYTPAVPKDMKELLFLNEAGFVLHKRSEILGLITRSYDSLAVAGTHGKSSVTAMITQILIESGAGCTAFLGAISKSIKSNLTLSDTSRFAVVEADEFDRSFLRLDPYLGCITSMDADHLDIYGDYPTLVQGFTDFVNRIRRDSSVVIKKGLPLVPDPGRNLTLYSYSLNETDTDFHALNIRQAGLGYSFDIATPEGAIKGVVTRVPGITNVENAVAAASLAILAGVSAEGIRSGLRAFEGIVRRFDVRFNRSGVVYVDDYAHHPNEIRAIVQSLRLLFPGKKLTGIFQPHLYSRTRDFAAGFAEELSRLDELILLDLYPAREKPIQGVDSKLIFDMVSGIPRQMCSKQELAGRLPGLDIEVLLTIGAGDIDQLSDPIVKYLEENVA